MLGAVLGAVNRVAREIDQDPCPCGDQIVIGKHVLKIICKLPV